MLRHRHVLPAAGSRPPKSPPEVTGEDSGVGQISLRGIPLDDLLPIVPRLARLHIWRCVFCARTLFTGDTIFYSEHPAVIGRHICYHCALSILLHLGVHTPETALKVPPFGGA